jgi:hypothetical protein
MDSNNKTARVAGLLYLVSVVTGIFSLMYVPSQIFVHGDPAATVANITGSESLFRFGIAAGALDYVAFALLPLVLYKLLAPVNRTAALLMVVFALLSIPIDFIAIATQFDVLSLLQGSTYAQVFTPDQLRAEAMLLLDAYYNRIQVAQIFWGLWLFPLGYLVFKSGFLPRVLGALLMFGCFSYLITFAQTFFPHYDTPDFVMWPAAAAEIGTCLWLLIMGVRKPANGIG